MSTRRRLVSGVVALLAALLLYLLFWPVPIDPVAWDAPTNHGLVDPFAPNDRLGKSVLIDLGEHNGPEDVAGGPDGHLYTGTSDGRILRINPDNRQVEVFADTGGRPLGLEFDAAGNLIVANAYLGLQRVSQDGIVDVLTDSYNGQPITYADDVAVAADGMIYFSDASSKFGAFKSGGSYEASLYDLLEHGGHGRVFSFDPGTGATAIVMTGLNFANGVAVSDDQTFLVVNETGTYRALKHWLIGPQKGETDVLIDNLPGFPDNVNNGLNGRFWIGLVAPRNDLLDRLSGAPWLRKVVQRLPAVVRPKAVPSSHVIAVNEQGEVLMNLQDTGARVPALTGVYESTTHLWLSSLFGNRVAGLDKRDLANP